MSKKKRKIRTNGEGALSGLGTGNPTPSLSLTLALSHPVTPSLPRSLSHRRRHLALPPTTRRRREKGTNGPPTTRHHRPVRPSNPLHFAPLHPRVLATRKRRPRTGNRQPTSLPTSPINFEPKSSQNRAQSASISSKTKVRVSGFRRDDLGSNSKGLGRDLLLN